MVYQIVCLEVAVTTIVPPCEANDLSSRERDLPESCVYVCMLVCSTIVCARHKC